MLDSNNLSGQIPQHLLQVQSYKYEQLIIMDNFKEYLLQVQINFYLYFDLFNFGINWIFIGQLYFILGLSI